MRDKFVITENVSRGVSALAAVEESVRVSPGRGLVLVDGRTGVGKTEFLKWFHVQNRRTVFLRSFKEWSASWMIEDITLALGLPSKNIMKANLRQLIGELERQPRMLLIDEGDRVIRRESLLETIRDLHDATGVPIVLVSEGSGAKMLARKSDRTWGRVGQVVDFTNLSVADVQMLGKELCDLEIPRREAEIIHQDSDGGAFRQVVGALEKVEGLVKANPGMAVSGKVVEMALRGRRAGR